jgi:hypothetical protein
MNNKTIKLTNKFNQSSNVNRNEKSKKATTV